VSEHSKGPWGLDSGGAYAISRRDGKAYGVALAYGETVEEKFANARLIAAAPEMYQMLQQWRHVQAVHDLLSRIESATS
jgi:hypothetical protein